MVGTYKGKFQLFGLDNSNKPIIAMSWNDTLLITNPRIETNRALADVHDKVYTEGHPDPREIKFFEGILIEEDGSAGQQFFEMHGEVVIFEEKSPGHFEYRQDFTDHDFQFWPNVTKENLVEVYHKTTKIVAEEEGLETHHIKRITHIVYKDNQGKKVALEYTSLEGSHKKVANQSSE